MKIIDPHLHLFDLKKGQYHWLKPENDPKWPDKHVIHKDFSEQDLLDGNSSSDEQSCPLDLCGFVHIEAGFDNEQPWHEIEWLESNCTLPFKSIASIDLTLSADEFHQQIDKLKRFSSVVGVRHILDADTAAKLNLSNVQKNLRCIYDLGLIFELQADFFNDETLNLLIENFAKEQKDQSIIVINHAGFPAKLTDNEKYKKWQRVMNLLSHNPKVMVKCSGWEMTDRLYSQDWVSNIVHQVIDIFGLERVMCASNFPLCTFSKPYDEVWQMFASLSAQPHKSHVNTLSDKQKKALFHDNAFSIYGFDSH